MNDTSLQESKPVLSSAVTRLIWRVYFLLAALQGASAVVFSLGILAKKEAAFPLDLSLGRMTIVAVLMIVMLTFAWLFLEAWFRPVRFDKRTERLAVFLSRPKVTGSAMILIGFGFIVGSYFITLVPEITEPFTKGLFDRLLPLVIWGTGLCAQTLIALPLLRNGVEAFKKLPGGKPFFLSVAIFGVIFLVWSWVSHTILPQESQVTGWNGLGSPIIETQLMLAWATGLVMLALVILIPAKSKVHPWLQWFKPRRIDLLISLLLWLVSVILWQSMPIEPNWFISKPRPPNFENYPLSDAQNYDKAAQTALVGEGFEFFDTPFIRRPIHAELLTILHLLGGQKYNTVIALQILILALLPPMIYFLTKTLHNRVSGVMAAVLVMLREASSIAIGSRVTTSHAKLLMTDLPAMLAVMAFTCVAVYWLQQMELRKINALLAGGFLGLAMLIRAEVFILFLALISISGLILLFNKRRALWIKSTLLLLLGIVLVISPWVWRNWKLTGQVFLDSPLWRADLILQRFRPVTSKPEPIVIPTTSVTETPANEPIKTPAGISPTSATPQLLPSANQAYPKPGGPEQDLFTSAIKQALNFVGKNPGQVAGFILTHYLNSQIQTFLILPTTFRPLDSFVNFLGHKSPSKLWFECCSVLNYVRRMPYWHKWNGEFPSQAIIPIAFNLVIVAIGIREAWKRYKLVGLAPLVFDLVYVCLNAIFRNSGGRYILPVDWITILYYSIGLAQIFTGVVGYFTNLKIVDTMTEDSALPTSVALQTSSGSNLARSRKFYLSAVCLFLLGCTLPFTESIIPERYTEARRMGMLNTLMGSDMLSEAQSRDLQTFLSQGGVVFFGRALYPQFYQINEGEANNDILEPRAYPRIGFFLAGPQRVSLILPFRKQNIHFPDASDIIAVGCPDQELWLVAIFNPSGLIESILTRSPFPSTLTCPLPAVEK
jgi:hypothetical protein